MPKAPAENALVKKEMTKVKNCTKKYRKAVRAYYKASATLNKCPATNTKRRATLYKKSEKANAKADEIQDQCTGHRLVLESMMRSGKVVKEETKTKIHKMVADLEKEEQDWSSNTSSDKSAMR
jgi:hypothetical protein